MIALDIDNTLAATNPALWRLFPDADRTRCHGAPVPPTWFGTETGRRFLAELRPLRGARRAAWLLARRARLVYVTSRPPATVAETWAWLRRFHFPCGLLIFAGSSAAKARWAALLRIELAIDDDPAAAAAYRAAGVRCLLPRWRYNADDPEAAPWPGLWQALDSSAPGSRQPL